MRYAAAQVRADAEETEADRVRSFMGSRQRVRLVEPIQVPKPERAPAAGWAG